MVAYPMYDVLGKVSFDWVGGIIPVICLCLTLFGLPQPVVVWGMGEHGRQGSSLLEYRYHTVLYVLEYDTCTSTGIHSRTCPILI